MSKRASINCLIKTKNAIINDEYTFIKPHSKYFPLQISTYIGTDKQSNDSKFLLMIFRRLCRLKPFISDRKMVKDTYSQYIHYKFTKENYQLKRSKVLPQQQCRNPDSQYLPYESIYNSLTFVLKAVSAQPEGKDKNLELARDNLMCKQILKNLLSIEFDKHTVVKQCRGVSRSVPYQSLYSNYDYLVLDKAKYNKKLSRDTFTNSVIGIFDRNLILLNEMIDTRL
ncbi:hypothetical protein TBLA_0A08480 [Henningerozyma blattae CBS 6284]|uniref:Increased recombination centers protein 19 n=1 Tax=Henningerozyma blattae (strain ATCC 34711 / CBS 6284 / DSM 70876 / NBRC 10599 / NRRL Y-10934 / UCD 77-7) TaxID=1071380 RepID=I2GWY5_HENB6|nr:hypothetical protein TBLA_0A08480 [Tetrapisispora blattae CBS 6284]CCH58637.1 hypothetical protein TBLA_0A08480 [Tetrapisispora blattae CBS 6284]